MLRKTGRNSSRTTDVTIIGDPIGREAFLQELEYEMIPYTPEELVEIANKEFAWCEAEMKKASREMGFGDDWKKALEAVKNKYVEPGKQAELIRNQAYEAIEFLEKNDLVTIPKLARESWRMEMMSPERQLVAPFFLGGETILVSYPTSGDDARAKNDVRCAAIIRILRTPSRIMNLFPDIICKVL